MVLFCFKVITVSLNNSSPVTEERFISLYRESYVSFCCFANRYVHNPLVAEDIVGDVALRVWEKKETLKNDPALKSYFYTSIHNACLTWINKEKTKLSKQGLYHDFRQPEQPSLLENIIRSETMQQVQAAIYRLPPQCRTVFIKLFIEGKSLLETAEEMQLSLSTIKNQRQRGIKLLRKRLPPIALFVLMMHLAASDNVRIELNQQISIKQFSIPPLYFKL